MLNCPTCEFADFEHDKCTRLLKHLPHICPYAVERKPCNHFEKIKTMSMEDLAELFSHLCCPYSLGGKVDCNAENKGCKACWLNWLKEEIKND